MKTRISIINLLLGAIVLSSCKVDVKEEPKPLVVSNPTENQIPDGSVKFVLSVQVVSPTYANTREEGLAAAKVIINQNGRLDSAIVNESGIATFNELREGEISIFVKGPAGYSSYNTSATLTRNFNKIGEDQTDVEQYQFARKVVNLSRMNASIKGVAYGNFDFDLDETPKDLDNFDQVPVVLKYEDKNMQPNVFVAETNPINGEFSFTNIPEGKASLYIGDHTVVNPDQIKNVFSISMAVEPLSSISKDLGYVILNKK